MNGFSLKMKTDIELFMIYNIARWHVEQQLKHDGCKGYLKDLAIYDGYIEVQYKVTGRIKNDNRAE